MNTKRFNEYIVDSNKRYGGAKNVSELTENEAKRELCDAMDLIYKLKENAEKTIEQFNKWGKQ